MANTIKIIILSLVILGFSNCRNKTDKGKEYNSFVYIDMSYYDGWTNYYSLKLFNDGKMYVYNNQHRKGDLYYLCTINNNALDSISKTVSVILCLAENAYFSKPSLENPLSDFLFQGKITG